MMRMAARVALYLLLIVLARADIILPACRVTRAGPLPPVTMEQCSAYVEPVLHEPAPPAPLRSPLAYNASAFPLELSCDTLATEASYKAFVEKVGLNMSILEENGLPTKPCCSADVSVIPKCFHPQESPDRKTSCEWLTLLCNYFAGGINCCNAKQDLDLDGFFREVFGLNTAPPDVIASNPSSLPCKFKIKSPDSVNCTFLALGAAYFCCSVHKAAPDTEQVTVFQRASEITSILSLCGSSITISWLLWHWWFPEKNSVAAFSLGLFMKYRAALFIALSDLFLALVILISSQIKNWPCVDDRSSSCSAQGFFVNFFCLTTASGVLWYTLCITYDRDEKTRLQYARREKRFYALAVLIALVLSSIPAVAGAYRDLGYMCWIGNLSRPGDREYNCLTGLYCTGSCHILRQFCLFSVVYIAIIFVLRNCWRFVRSLREDEKRFASRRSTLTREGARPLGERTEMLLGEEERRTKPSTATQLYKWDRIRHTLYPMFFVILWSGPIVAEIYTMSASFSLVSWVYYFLAACVPLQGFSNFVFILVLNFAVHERTRRFFRSMRSSERPLLERDGGAL